VVGDGEGSRADPDRLDITLSGPPALVDTILPGQIRLVADVDGLDPSRRDHDVEVRVEFIDVTPRDQKRISVEALSRRQVRVRVSGDDSR
jgi:hypothetical protein